MKIIATLLVIASGLIAQTGTRNVSFVVEDTSANPPATTFYDVLMRAKDPVKTCPDPTNTGAWTTAGSTVPPAKTVTLPVALGKHCVAVSARAGTGAAAISSPPTTFKQLDITPFTPADITFTVEMALREDGTVQILRASATAKAK